MQASFIGAACGLAAKAPGAVSAAAVAAAAAGEAILSASESRAELGAAAVPPASDDSTLIANKPRKERVPITIAVKKHICRLRSQGRTRSSVLAALPAGVSKEAARKVYRARHKWLAMPNDDATEMRTVMRKGNYDGVDDRLRQWLAVFEQLDHKTVPIFFGLLQAREKLPIAIIGKSKAPLCFQGA